MSALRGWRVAPAPSKGASNDPPDVQSMLAVQELLSFWQSLLHLKSTDEVGQKLVDFFDKSFANLDCVQLYVLEESETDPAMLRICGGIGKGEMAELSKSSLAEAIEKCEPLLIEPTHLEPQGTLALPLFSQLPPKHGLALDSSPRNSSTEVDAAPTPPKVNPMESERAAAAASAAAALSASVTSTTTPAAHGRNSGGLDTKSMRPIGIMVLKRTPLIPPPTPSRHWRERRSSDNNINLSAGRLRRSSDNSLRFDPSLSRFRRSSDESIKVDGGSPGVSGRGTPLAVRGLRERRISDNSLQDSRSSEGSLYAGQSMQGSVQGSLQGSMYSSTAGSSTMHASLHATMHTNDLT